MKEKNNDKKVVLCTFSNFKSGSFGDATNDKKLYDAIPSNYRKAVIYPIYTENNKLNLKTMMKFLIYYLKEISTSNNTFITRGSKLAILLILFKSLFKNKVIVRLGCTPLMFVERKAFLKNLEFKAKNIFLLKILIFFESFIEKFTLRHADKFIVENEKAKNLSKYFGAKLSKIEIILHSNIKTKGGFLQADLDIIISIKK